jgi:ribosomal protein L29
MKRKDIKNLHHKSVTELTKEVEVKRRELTKQSLERTVKREKNTRLLNTLRDDIARIETVLKVVSLKSEPKV